METKKLYDENGTQYYPEINIGQILLKAHPVGSIYFTVDNTNPADPSIFGGGTWIIWGKGRVPVGVDENNPNFNQVEKEIGTESVTLTVNQIPSHTHTFTGNAHTHSIPAHAHGLNSHTHTVAAHNHTFSGTTSNEGSHEHSVKSSDTGNKDLNSVIAVDAGDYGNWGSKIETVSGYHYGNADLQPAGSHTHTYSGTTSTKAQFNTGAASGSTANSSSLTSGSTTQSGTNSSVGGGQAHSNIQPSITCYMWKRTA